MQAQQKAAENLYQGAGAGPGGPQGPGAGPEGASGNGQGDEVIDAEVVEEKKH
jgi:hypothetical protein